MQSVIAVLPSQLGKSKQTSTTMAFAAEQSALPSGMLSSMSKHGEVPQVFDLDSKNSKRYLKNNRSDSVETNVIQNIKPKIIMR